MKTLIEVRIADDELEELSRGGPQDGPRLSRLLDDEMARFEAWMQNKLRGDLTSMEKNIVKTYLYHKIVGNVDQLETKNVDTLDLVTAKTG